MVVHKEEMPDVDDDDENRHNEQVIIAGLWRTATDATATTTTSHILRTDEDEHSTIEIRI